MTAQERYVSDIEAMMRSFYSQYVNDDIVIFGTGSYGRMLCSFFSKIGMGKNVVAFCDNNQSAWGQHIGDVLVESVDTVSEKYPEAIYLIASGFYKDIVAGLQGRNLRIVYTRGLLRFLEGQLAFVTAKRPDDEVVYAWKWMKWYEELNQTGKLQIYIAEVQELLDDERSREVLSTKMQFFLTGDVSCIEKIPCDIPAYSNAEYLPFDDSEVFFDCGAYIGDSVEDFVRFTKGKYKKILSFEPDEVNYNKLCSLIECNGYHDVVAIKAATGSHNGMVSFSNNGTGGAKIVNEAEAEVELVKLDNYIDEYPTFVKMDLEGAELDSLKGMERILREQKPKLAICVYHKWLDFYEIPMYLHQIVPEYRFKLRHHEQDTLYDTVLYAWVDSQE